jgi:hypothetical protein
MLRAASLIRDVARGVCVVSLLGSAGASGDGGRPRTPIDDGLTTDANLGLTTDANRPLVDHGR